MPLPISPPNSSDDWLNLDHLVPDAPLPAFPDLPLETLIALNQETVEDTVYDEAYFAESLASKNPEPFVL
jgi:hypothetical protein